MNFSFEGNYKPRRNINLGGIRSHEDKKTLMAKAQAERRAREHERQRQRCAVKIQVMETLEYYNVNLYWQVNVLYSISRSTVQSETPADYGVLSSMPCKRI